MSGRGEADGRGSGLVVAAQILEWKGEIWTFWCELARHLAAQGQQLLLLSPWSPPTRAEWPVVLPMPYAMGEFTVDAGGPAQRDYRWDHLLETDALYRTFLPTTRTAGIGELASLQSYVRAVFEELVPDVVMGWAPPFPPSRLLLGEARRRETPSFGLELGFLPDTLMVESQDVGFGSDLISHPAVVSALAAHVAVPGRVDRMRQAYAAQPREIGSLLRTEEPGPLVVLLGSCPGFNLQPRDSRLIRLGSPWFGTFEEAAVALRAAAPADARLVLRPHPADAAGQRYCRSPGAVGTLMADLSIRSVVESADVVAVLGSTRTQLEVALLGIPIVLLSRSVLWGQGIAYEYDGSNLAAQVALALARDGAPVRAAAAERLLDFQAAHCLYGLAGSAASRGPDGFATFLRRFSLDPEPRDVQDARVTRFNARVAPLLASYVCREVASAQRRMRPAYQPYLEAALVEVVVASGDTRAIVIGADAVAQRIGARLIDAGLEIDAYLDDDAAGDVIDGVAVHAWTNLAAVRGTTVVIASYAEESDLRGRLHAAGLPRASHIVGLATTVSGHEAPMAPGVRPEQVWMARAAQYLSRGEVTGARSALEQARRVQPAAPEPVHRLALLARGQGEAASRVWALMSEALDLGGQTPELLLDAGFAALATGRVAEADALGQRAARARPTVSYPWHLRALCARQAGAPGAVLGALLDEALSRTPVTAELAYDAACAAVDAGRMDRGEALALAAVGARPDWAAPHHLAAICLRHRGAPVTQVRHHLEAAQALGLSSPALLFDLASLHHASGELAQAERLSRQAGEGEPAWSAPWYLLAVCLRARQAPAAEVHDAFERGLTGAPVTLALVIEAGFAALVAKQYERADGLAEQAEMLQPSWSVPRHLRALAARARGERPAVIAELMRRAMHGDATSPELAYDAAAAVFDLGECAEADRYVGLALAARPDWDEARGLQLAIHAQLPTHGSRP